MVLNDFTETHCHILPGIDDGSPNVETSLKMIAKLQAEGAKSIICTPHYYSDTLSLDDFLEKRNAAYNKLAAALPPGSPKLILGAEVYITRYLFGNENLQRIKIEGTDYALIEHSFSEDFSSKACDRLVSLLCDWGVTPILAHIERYGELIQHPQTLDMLLDMGCIAQVNIASFADERRKVKKQLFKYLESGRIMLTGSDCHNLTARPPEYETGAKEIISKLGRGALNRLLENSNRLAAGEQIES